MRIRTRLFLIFLCVLLPALIVGIGGSITIHGEVRQAHRELPQQSARHLGSTFDREITARQTLLEMLADSPLIDDEDPSGFYGQAAALAARTASVIELDDEAGVTVYSSQRRQGSTMAPAVYGFRIPLPHGTPHALISDLFYSPSVQGFVFAIRIPVKLHGLPARSLTMVSPAASLQKILGEPALPAGWVATVLDRNNIVVARSAEASSYTGRHLNQGASEEVDQGPARNGNSDTGQGTAGTVGDGQNPAAKTAREDRPQALFQARSSLTGYRVIVSMPTELIDRDAFQTAVYCGAALAVLLSLALLGAIYLARQVLGPLETLQRAADELARGEPVQARPGALLELDHVISSMARASVELRSGRAELERQVGVAAAHSENARDAQQQKQKLEAMSRLTNAIAHDFNNVLQTMTSALQMAHSSAVTARARMLVETCERAVRRAVDLTRQLMAFGQSQEIEPETVDLAARIHAMNRLLRGTLPPSMDLRMMVADDLWPVTLDATQFELTLLNLTINARDAMDQGGVLQISVFNETLFHEVGELPAGDFILVTLDGSGDGNVAHTLADAIEASGNLQGTGTSADLGLPQAYGFARQCGGTLLLHEGSRGKKFTLYLPRARAGNDKDATDELLAHQDKSMASLLFVEDDLLVREVVSPALRDAGFDVVDAVDGDTALAMLESGRHFDLVFSDIMMPGQLNGIGLAQHVKRDYPATRVILTTGYSQEKITVPGIQVLGKPYAIGEVVTVLNAELADMHPA